MELFEVCATLKHEKPFFSNSANFVGRTNSCAPQSWPSLKKMAFHVLTSHRPQIAPYEAKFQTATPKGCQTQGKNRFRPKKMSFRHFVIQRFCLFREFAKKTKSLNNKMSKTHFFWSKSIFSLRLTPFRGRSLKFCFVWSYLRSVRR